MHQVVCDKVVTSRLVTCVLHDTWMDTNLFIAPMGTLDLVLKFTEVVFSEVQSHHSVSSWQ